MATERRGLCDRFKPISDVYQCIGTLYLQMSHEMCVHCGHQIGEHDLSMRHLLGPPGVGAGSTGSTPGSTDD